MHNTYGTKKGVQSVGLGRWLLALLEEPGSVHSTCTEAYSHLELPILEDLSPFLASSGIEGH